MTNGQPLNSSPNTKVQRIVPDAQPCPKCGKLARIILQIADLPKFAPLMGISGNRQEELPQRLELMENFTICLHCLDRGYRVREGEKMVLRDDCQEAKSGE